MKSTKLERAEFAVGGAQHFKKSDIQYEVKAEKKASRWAFEVKREKNRCCASSPLRSTGFGAPAPERCQLLGRLAGTPGRPAEHGGAVAVAGAGCCSRAGWAGVHLLVRNEMTLPVIAAARCVIVARGLLIVPVRLSSSARANSLLPSAVHRVSPAVPTAASLFVHVLFSTLRLFLRRMPATQVRYLGCRKMQRTYAHHPWCASHPHVGLHTNPLRRSAHSCLRWHRSSAPEPALHGLACAHVLSAQGSEAACIKSKFRLATFAEVSGKCPFALKPHPAAALHHAAPLPRGRPCFSSRVAFRPLRGTPNRCIVRFYCRLGACTQNARTACRMPCVHAYACAYACAWEWLACGRQRANALACPPVICARACARRTP